MLTAVEAHSDDIPLFAGGTVSKLIDEGCTGYLIRVSNDEAARRTLGFGVVQNENDIHGAAQALGCKKALSFYYRNHRMDDNAAIEIRKGLSEHYKAGLKPASVREKYYHPRSPHGHNLVNRIVDIHSYIDHKVRSNVANSGKGPVGTTGSRLRNELAKQGQKLPFLGDDDETANFEYVKRFLMDDFHLMDGSSAWSAPKRSVT